MNAKWGVFLSLEIKGSWVSELSQPGRIVTGIRLWQPLPRMWKLALCYAAVTFLGQNLHIFLSQSLRIFLSQNLHMFFGQNLHILSCISVCFYYPFKKYVEYIFSPGCLSMMSRSVLRLWLAAWTIASFVFVGDCLKQFKTINTNNHKLED